MKGIIFDFNGTLFWDSQLHYDAWREYSKILRGTEFTDEEMRLNMFGRTNKDIIKQQTQIFYKSEFHCYSLSKFKKIIPHGG